MKTLEKPLTSMFCPECYEGKLNETTNQDATCGTCHTEFRVIGENTVAYKNK